MTPSPECLLEMKRKGILANEFLRRGERARYDELRKEADLLGQAGLSTREIEALYEKGKTVTQNRAYRRQFERYLAGEIETRDFLVGAPEATLAYSNLAGGGAFVPYDYDPTLRATRNQVDRSWMIL